MAALVLVRVWTSEVALTLHSAKTHVGDCRLSGQGFEFLGYRFEAGVRRVRQKSLAKLKDSIRAKTARNRGDSLVTVIVDLNPALRGWFGYFKHAHAATFTALDGFIRRRLRAMLLKQKKKVHFGIGTLISKTWPNAYFADLGLFTLKTAWASARQSRSG